VLTEWGVDPRSKFHGSPADGRSSVAKSRLSLLRAHAPRVDASCERYGQTKAQSPRGQVTRHLRLGIAEAEQRASVRRLAFWRPQVGDDLPRSEVGNRRSHESEKNHLNEAPHDIKVAERMLLSHVVVHVVILSIPVDEIALRTRVEASK